MASTVDYKIVPASDGWAIVQGTDTTAGYLTKEAAFEAAVAAASNAIKVGHGVSISVEGASDGEPSLGKR